MDIMTCLHSIYLWRSLTFSEGYLAFDLREVENLSLKIDFIIIKVITDYLFVCVSGETKGRACRIVPAFDCMQCF